MAEKRVKKVVVFTDLDGALLELKTYSFEGARHALKLLRERDIPIILTTSKTRREVELWRSRLGVQDPFISENGGGVFIPTHLPLPRPEGTEVFNGYWGWALGVPYREIRRAVEDLRRRGFLLKGFGDMTAEEVAQITGMTLEEAILAKAREFSEPCLFEGDELQLKKALQPLGLSFWRGGRFLHIQGPHDKGRGMGLVTDLYRKVWGDVQTIALGDSPNDLPMLQRADWPVVVRRRGGLSDNPPPLKGLMVTSSEGPRGWGEAITKLLSQIDDG